jgi:hypothetical protein
MRGGDADPTRRSRHNARLTAHVVDDDVLGAMWEVPAVISLEKDII